MPVPEQGSATLVMSVYAKHRGRSASARNPGPSLKRRTALLSLVAGLAPLGQPAPAYGVPFPRLRGVALGDCLLARSHRPDSDFGVVARGWGANIVRLSVHPGLWRARPSEMIAAIRSAVSAALAEGLSVILDWHVIGWPGGAFERPDPSWGLPGDLYDSDPALASAFWSHMASLYGDRQDVLFELWNEPVDLRRGEDEPSFGADWDRLRPVWISLLGSVRTRASNSVLVSGGSWAADLTGVRQNPIRDDRVGYAWHVYPGTGDGHPERWSVLLDDLDRSAPVFVTEWGFGGGQHHLRGTAGGFGSAFAAGFLEERRLNWTAWCWQPEWDPSLIEADWRTPTPYGEFVLGLLRRKRDC